MIELLKAAVTMFLIASFCLLFTGCYRHDAAHIQLPQVKDESEIVVACPDDGVHIVVAGHCVDTDHPEK